MRSNYKRIGDYIREVDERNAGLKVKNLLGLSISKQFISSVANIVGTDMENYKIIRKNQFACSIMQVRRDKKMPVALLKEVDEAIISQAYPVFKIIDTNVLMPEYLMMWFSRQEFDREACFYAVGGVRGSLEWGDFLDMKLPVPHIDKQKEIVKEYNVIINRIDLNNKLIKRLEETAQSVYKHWFVDFEFPDENGKPYKSNGGEMSYNEELEKEIPKGWEVKKLGTICDIKGGKRLPNGESLNKLKKGNPYIRVADMRDTKFIILDEKFEYVDESVQKSIARYIVSKGDVIISIVGTIGLVNLVHENLDKANLTENCAKFTNLRKISNEYLYYFLNSRLGQNEIETKTVGGVQGKLPLYNIQSFSILCPLNDIIDKFSSIISRVNGGLKLYVIQNSKLAIIKELLFAKMSKLN